MSTITMPASVAWRVLGAPRSGAERLHPAPRLPGYRLLREIGTGRRSSAWLAHDDAQQAQVVLKLQPALQSSLHREWELASLFASRQVVRVHDHGRAGAWAWLAMEYLEGGDLAQRLRAPLEPLQALVFLRDAALGLAELHRKGLVHRDVKPANFLLRGDGSLVLADFGLAVPAGAAPAAAQEQPTITGTPRYVAPEQLQGGAATAAADVYSLGVLLHEMLCGRPPFSGVTLMEVLSQHLLATPARLPAPLAQLQRLVDRMLAKEVQHRLPDADAVLGLMGQRWFK